MLVFGEVVIQMVGQEAPDALLLQCSLRTLLTPPLLRCGCSCCLHACILRKSSTEVQKVLREVVFQTIGGGFTRL